MGECCRGVGAAGSVRRAAELRVDLCKICRGGLTRKKAEGAAVAAAEHRSRLLVPGGAAGRQWKGGDSPKCWTSVGRSWPSLEKKELAVELVIRYKAEKTEIKG